MPGVIEVDTRQQDGKHQLKHDYFRAHGYQLVRTKLYVGDYRFVGGVRCVDTKQHFAEIASNIDNQHERFRRELIKARDAGYELTVLVENEHGVTTLEEFAAWRETPAEFARRKHAVRRLDGMRLAKAMMTMHERYGVSWAFCSPQGAGERVLRILEGGG